MCVCVCVLLFDFCVCSLVYVFMYIDMCGLVVSFYVWGKGGGGCMCGG